MTSFPFINKPTIKTVRQSVRIYILSSSFFTQKETLMNAFFNETNLWSYCMKKKSFRYWLNLGFSLFYNYKLACTIPNASQHHLNKIQNNPAGFFFLKFSWHLKNRPAYDEWIKVKYKIQKYHFFFKCTWISCFVLYNCSAI